MIANFDHARQLLRVTVRAPTFPFAPRAAAEERGTGFEPATTSLEGWCSATELPPHINARGLEPSCLLLMDVRRAVVLQQPGRPPVRAGISSWYRATTSSGKARPFSTPGRDFRSASVVPLCHQQLRRHRLNVPAWSAETFRAKHERRRVEMGREGFKPPKA